MSDHWLIVLTADPLALPPKSRIDEAFALLQQLRPEGDEPELHVTDTPVYFDCGENFVGVFCPFCEAGLTEWLGEAMDRWWKGDRRDLAVETPCCHRATSLNDLDYQAPQGLACVAMELMNAGPDLEPEERQQIEAALGLPVRVVWRYM